MAGEELLLLGGLLGFGAAKLGGKSQDQDILRTLQAVSLIQRYDEVSRASDGSTTQLVDSSRNWAINSLRGATLYVVVKSSIYTSLITENTSSSITISPALPVPIEVGSVYAIKIASQLAYSQGDWSALKSQDKNFQGDTSGTPANFGDFIDVSYNPPANKTLYVTQFSWFGHASNNYDGDENQMVLAVIRKSILMTYPWRQAGNGGGFAIFPKPIVLPYSNPGDGSWYFEVISKAYHPIEMGFSVSGYEI